ncbi:hypothetical protein D3C78_829920 [compost metagenome]
MHQAPLPAVDVQALLVPVLLQTQVVAPLVQVLAEVVDLDAVGDLHLAGIAAEVGFPQTCLAVGQFDPAQAVDEGRWLQGASRGAQAGEQPQVEGQRLQLRERLGGFMHFPGVDAMEQVAHQLRASNRQHHLIQAGHHERGGVEYIQGNSQPAVQAPQPCLVVFITGRHCQHPGIGLEPAYLQGLQLRPQRPLKNALADLQARLGNGLANLFVAVETHLEQGALQAAEELPLERLRHLGRQGTAVLGGLQTDRQVLGEGAGRAVLLQRCQGRTGDPGHTTFCRFAAGRLWPDQQHVGQLAAEDGQATADYRPAVEHGRDPLEQRLQHCMGRGTDFAFHPGPLHQQLEIGAGGFAHLLTQLLRIARLVKDLLQVLLITPAQIEITAQGREILAGQGQGVGRLALAGDIAEVKVLIGGEVLQRRFQQAGASLRPLDHWPPTHRLAGPTVQLGAGHVQLQAVLVKQCPGQQGGGELGDALQPGQCPGQAPARVLLRLRCIEQGLALLWLAVIEPGMGLALAVSMNRLLAVQQRLKVVAIEMLEPGAQASGQALVVKEDGGWFRGIGHGQVTCGWNGSAGNPIRWVPRRYITTARVLIGSSRNPGGYEPWVGLGC